MKLFKLLLLFFFVQTGHAQFEGYSPTLPIQSSEIYKSSNIYQKDFLYLCDGLIAFHANVYLNFPKEEYEKQRATYYKQLAACANEIEFGRIANKFISHIKDGHASVKIQGTTGKNNVYPFRCKYLVDTLTIMAVSDQLSFELCGEKIKSINGIDIKEIEKRASQVYLTENYIRLQNITMSLINSSEYLKSIEVIQSDTDHVSITTYSGKEFSAVPNFNGTWKSEIPNKPSITERQAEPFSYKIDKENNLCYIQFNMMVDRRVGEMYLDLIPFWHRWFVKTIRFFGGSGGFSKIYFEDFLNSCLEEIEKNNIKKVIVDLRWNTGGSFILGNQLLYALNVDKYEGFSSDINVSELYKLQNGAIDNNLTPVVDNSADDASSPKLTVGVEKIKRIFSGDVYFITSEWTFSSAVMLATIVKDNNLFKIVGEPISERPSHFGEVLFLKLPNTNIVCSLSSKLFHRPNKLKDNEETLYPDVTIYKTYDDIKNGRDAVYEWIVKQ